MMCARFVAAILIAASASAQFTAIGVDGWHYRGAIYARPEHVPPFIWEINGRTGQEQQVVDLMRFVREARPGAIVGRYTSATTTIRGQNPYALPAFVPIEALAADEILPVSYDAAGQRPYIDIRKPAARMTIAYYAASRARADGCGAISFDNLSWGMGVPPTRVMSVAEWQAAELELLRETHAAARAFGVRLVANVACSPRVHWPVFADHVDGVLCELPMHPSHVAPRVDLVAAELAAYSTMLRAGKFVGLIPVIYPTPPGEDAATARAKWAELLAAALMLVYERGDLCGVYEPSFRPLRRDWWGWAERWGAPRGAFRIDGGVFVREFDRAVLRVDFAARTVSVAP